MTLRSKKGAVLVLAVVIIMVLVVLTGASLTAAYLYYQRSINNSFAKQAFFTSRSIAETIVSELENGTDGGDAICSQLDEVGDSVYLDRFTFSDELRYTGTAIATVTLLEGGIVEVTATATVSSFSKSVTLKISRDFVHGLPIEIYFGFYDLVPDDAVYVDGIMNVSRYYYNDIYSQGNYGEGGSSNIILLGNSRYDNTVYAEPGTVININNNARFSGTIFCGDGVILSIGTGSNVLSNPKIYIKDGSTLTINSIVYTFHSVSGNVTASPALSGNILGTMEFYD